MKAEHRKELHTNVLADRLGKTFQSMKEGPSRGTLLVAGLLVLAAVLVFTWRYFAASARENDSARWQRWDSLFVPQQLEAFAGERDVQGTTQARLARFQLARLQLHEGLRELGSARDRARENIGKATGAYEKLIEEARDIPLLQQEALLGAAKGYESVGDFDRARALYDRLARDHPGSTPGVQAQEDIRRLSDDAHLKELQELAAQFAPKPDTPGKAEGAIKTGP